MLSTPSQNNQIIRWLNPTRIVGSKNKSVVRHRVDLASTSHLLLVKLRLFSNYGKPGWNEIVGIPSRVGCKYKRRMWNKLTRSMHDSFLSYAMVTYFLELLNENGSLEYDIPTEMYKNTDCGLRFLRLHKKRDMLLFSTSFWNYTN